MIGLVSKRAHWSETAVFVRTVHERTLRCRLPHFTYREVFEKLLGMHGCAAQKLFVPYSCNDVVHRMSVLSFVGKNKMERTLCEEKLEHGDYI